MRSDFVGCNNKFMMIIMNEVNNSIRFYVFQRSVDIGGMFVWGWHEFADIVSTHRNDDLFVG